MYLNNYVCKFCDNQGTSSLLDGFDHRIIDCPQCGKYVISDNYLLSLDGKELNCINSYLLYNNGKDKIINYFGDEKYLRYLQENHDNLVYFSPELKKQYLNIKFLDIIDSFLIWVWKQCEYLGQTITLDLDSFDRALFIKKFKTQNEQYTFDEINEQRQIILKYLEYDDDPRSNRYLENLELNYEEQYIAFKLTLKALRKIENIQKNLSYGKKVFIAISFADETKIIREAIKNGIVNAGYEPTIINERIHNQQIVPEIFKQIRDAKFLVIDVSVPNNGAYYEAGYASGLGKEVIFCCKKEIFENEKTRPHFDVSQKQMIIWTDERELSEKLSSWIKSLFE